MGARPSSVDSQHPAYVAGCVPISASSKDPFSPKWAASSRARRRLYRAVFTRFGVRSDGRDGVPALRELPALRLVERKAARQLRAQRVRLDHGVDDQLGGEVENVDVGSELSPLLL